MSNDQNDPILAKPLKGCWINMDDKPDWFRAITFSHGDEGLSIKPHCVHEPMKWGAASVDTFAFKGNEVSFHASFKLEGLEAELAAYTNKGLIVLATYLAFADEPGRNYLCRDFFVPISMTGGNIEEDRDPGAGNKAPCQEEGPCSALLGTWFNTDAANSSIAKVKIHARPDGSYGLRTYSCFGPRLKDWGEITIATHVAAHNQTGFHGSYDFGDVSMELAANNKLGVLVILCCTSFHDDSGRPGYMVRSFLRREEPAT